MSPRPEQESGRGKFAGLIHEQRKEQLRRFRKLPTLYGLDKLRYDDEDGTIWYMTWGELPKDGLLSPQYVPISALDTRADIYARHTRYTEKKQIVIKHVMKDGGSVEAAIRAMDYILAGQKDTQLPQVTAVKAQVLEMFDQFGASDFTHMTASEFEALHRKTRRRLQKVGLNPDTVLSDEKRKMALWLLKASLGKDSQKRRNQMITYLSLDAAYRRAVARERGIGEITGTFLAMREALIRQRMIARANFNEIVEFLSPRAFPSSVVFEQFDKPLVTDTHIAIGLITNMRSLLSEAHLKRYRTAAIKTDQILAEAIALLQKGRRREVVKRQLFPKVRTLLEEELVRTPQ